MHEFIKSTWGKHFVLLTTWVDMYLTFLFVCSFCLLCCILKSIKRYHST